MFISTIIAKHWHIYNDIIEGFYFVLVLIFPKVFSKPLQICMCFRTGEVGYSNHEISVTKEKVIVPCTHLKVHSEHYPFKII